MTENLKEVIAAQGLSWEAASLKSNLERSYFRKLFERGGASPRGNTLRKISIGLGIAIGDLLGAGGDEEPSEAKLESKSELRAATATLPPFAQMAKDVPVMGTAAGSHIRGAFQLTTDPVDYVRRPPSLMNARNVYSLYVEGSSMEPQYFPGDLVYVHPDKPPRFGDVVIVQCQLNAEGLVEATIGIFSKRTAEKIMIRKHNPAAEIEIARDTVITLHKVLSVNEIYGV